jgi:hypothetical protein
MQTGNRDDLNRYLYTCTDENVWETDNKPININSIDWLLTLEGRPEDEVVRYFDQKLSTSTLLRLTSKKFPDLPNFGIFCMSVTEAASLVARDLAMSHRYPFDKIEEIDLSNSDCKKRINEIKEPLIKRLEARIMEAVIHNNMPSIFKAGDLKDFVDRECDAMRTRHTYIHYVDLLQWLVRSGYIEWESVCDCPILGEYGFKEYALALEVEALVKLRHNVQRDDLVNGALYGEKEYRSRPGVVIAPRYANPFKRALEKIVCLESQLKEAQNRNSTEVEKPLSIIEKRSILKILATACNFCGFTEYSHDLTGKFDNRAQSVGYHINNTTMRKWLKLALATKPDFDPKQQTK